MPSFDIVSQINSQEVDNAVNQAKKEVTTRYDFRGSKSEIKLDKTEITLIGDDDMKMKALRDILESKMTKRGVSIKSLEYGKEEAIGGDLRKLVIKLVNGISKEKAKEIIKNIKDAGFKAQAQIMDEQVRVTSKSIDELQSVIAHVKGRDFNMALQFINMRS